MLLKYFFSTCLSVLPPILFITLGYLISEVQEIGMPEVQSPVSP